jgi:hypothetical protein
MQQPQQSGKPPMQRAEFEELVWCLWKEDGSPQLQLHSYMQGAIVMDRHYRSMAPASPVEELPDDLQGWFRDWCKATKRNGGILIGSSIREFIDYLSSKLTESKPSPVIEIGEQKQLADMLEQIAVEVCPHEVYGENPIEWEKSKARMDYMEGAKNGAFRMYQILSKASHPAPAPIVGERDKKTECTCICGPTDANPTCAWPNCFKPEENTGNSVVRTEQALPEEVKDWIRHWIVQHQYDFNLDGAEEIAIAMYHKMQEEMDQVIENAYAFNRLSVEQANELVELKETLRIATQNETSYRVWLEKSREELASARTLILNIKNGNIYQEPADECDKWLNNNPEVKP